MAAGAWVFPIGIVAFVAFLGTFLAANPATPASFSVVKPGDTITYEETAFYGDDYVAWTTREDLLEAGSLKIGPYGLIPKPREFTATLPSNGTNITDPTLTLLLGKHANETVRTEPRDEHFGGWEEEFTVNRTLGDLPILVTVRTGETLGGRPFNATQFTDSQAQQLGRPLRAGDRVNCDFGLCEIISFDASQVTYRHLIVDGATIGLDRFAFFPEQEPKPQSKLEVRTIPGDRFVVRWAPVEGDAFILRSTFAGFPPGYYRFESWTEDTLTLQYRGTEAYTSDGNLAPAHLVGQRVWFELVVTKIA